MSSRILELIKASNLVRSDALVITSLVLMYSLIEAYYTPNGIITTTKICFYFRLANQIARECQKCMKI